MNEQILRWLAQHCLTFQPIVADVAWRELGETVSVCDGFPLAFLSWQRIVRDTNEWLVTLAESRRKDNLLFEKFGMAPMWSADG